MAPEHRVWLVAAFAVAVAARRGARRSARLCERMARLRPRCGAAAASRHSPRSRAPTSPPRASRGPTAPASSSRGRRPGSRRSSRRRRSWSTARCISPRRSAASSRSIRRPGASAGSSSAASTARRNWGDFTNRGVSTWRDPAAAPDAPCRRRIFLATIDARLIALDARDGQACADFGDRGTVDLRHGPAQRAVRARRVRVDVAAGRHRRPHHRRLGVADNSRHATRRAARCAPSTRAPARCGGRGIPSRATPPIPRSRRWRGAMARTHRRGERVVGDRRRPGARPRVRPHRQPEPRLLRRRAARRQPLRELHRRAARVDRQGRLALPDRAPRPLGLRQRRRRPRS